MQAETKITGKCLRFSFTSTMWQKKYPRGLFRVCLPVDTLNRSETDFAALLQESMAEFPLAWGFAGYSFYWNTLHDDIEYGVREPLAETLKRHPGVSYGDTGFYLTAVEKGLGHVGWITMLGKDYVDQLEGVETLREKTNDTDIRLIEFGNGGVGLQAGEMPLTGDADRNETLSTQALVGEIVDPVRISDKEIDKFVYIEGFDIEDAQNWFKRCFKPSS